MPVARRRTSGRSRGSFHARPGSRVSALSRSGSASPRLTSTLAPAIVTVSLLGTFVAVTGPGRAIATAVLRFLLFYGGVFALIALTASVGVGLIATDRIVMKPGHRITAQAVHRSVSLAAVAFLIIHIWLEIAVGRSHLADAVVPFLARQRTFYIGLGTIGSDLILLIIASGFLRSWFAGFSQPWAWRAVHASSYLAWLLSIIHGLLGGRHAKPYVDWSYGACVAAVALALTVRLVVAHRSREEAALSAAGPAPGHAGWQSLPPALAQASVTQVPLSLPVSRALPAGPPPGPAASQATGGQAAVPASLGRHRMAAAGPGGFPPVPSPLGGPAPVPSRWDLPGQGPATAQPVAWGSVTPPASVWDRLPRERDPWDDLGPGPSPWEGLRPQSSPWDRLRPDGPPEPAARPAEPAAWPADDLLPRRVPGASRRYGGRPGDR